MPTAGAQLFGQLVHLRRPLLARADVDDLGAEQRVEQRVRRRRGRRLAVGHEHRAHSQLRRDGGRRARVIRLHPSGREDRKSTRLNSSHVSISYAVFCLKKKKKKKKNKKSYEKKNIKSRINTQHTNNSIDR